MPLVGKTPFVNEYARVERTPFDRCGDLGKSTGVRSTIEGKKRSSMALAVVSSPGMATRRIGDRSPRRRTSNCPLPRQCRSAVEQRITVDDGRQHGIADLRNIGSVGRRDAFIQLLDILESDLEREALRRDTTVEQCLEHERIVGAGRNTEAQPVGHRRRPKAVFS